MTLAVEIQEVRTAEELDHVRELFRSYRDPCLHTCDFPMPNGASCRERTLAPAACCCTQRMRGSLQDASAHLATMSAAVELYRQFGLVEVRRTQCLPLTEGLSYMELTL